MPETRLKDKLSLREGAQKAGVSHAATYHHFKDKTALVAAVAVADFAELGSSLQTFFDEAARDTVTRLPRFAHAYVGFALEYLYEFRVMFSPQLRSDAGLTEVERAGRTRDL